MNRQAWTQEVCYVLFSKITPSKNQQKKLDSMTGVKSQPHSKPNIRLAEGLASNVEKDGITTLVLLCLNSLGALQNSKSSFKCIKCWEIDGRIYPNHFQGGTTPFYKDRITTSKIIFTQLSDAVYEDLTKSQGREIQLLRCERLNLQC